MFKIGDVVQLKSGGPLMTVSNPGNEGSTMTCEWFTKDGESRADKFHPATLVNRPPPTP